ncbi:MAG: class I SAM-dependent methyltransferase [Desulfobacteraceae bacterium]|nr:class I SAM-dependent methyltransferase [Desulfobacteraceae bacterium]
MGLEQQGSKPTGYIGKIIGKLMNIMHTDLYIDYFKNDLPPEKSRILDIGCGGGKFIKFLSDTNDTYRLFGLDHSPEMVELAKRVNEQAIDNKQVVIIQGSIANILVKKASYDLITAFETIQFWPDIDKVLIEIARLLNIGGSFLIINRYPKEGSKWWKMANIKSGQEYKAKLEKAGFSDITIDLDFKKGWVIVKATKG